ncbi:uncharacterized protein LOC132270946 [Cornus florida]|uniref:uncharacterized protein LOC132270946 n=1 Tax=Cornus florida TaxID=4283 RepID=UPI0028973DA2|nr:uncharacterized protein LOC132270946 [Cornus florida]
MRSLSGVGLALSIVFGGLLLALVAELYILLWWKKRITNRDTEDEYISPAREFLCLLCWKRPSSSFSSTALNPQELCSSLRIIDTHVHEPQSQLHLHSNQGLWLKPFEEYGPETELMRLQNISGPPRFLFTIKEETKEDLESEDGNKSRDGLRSRSLSDLVVTVETPFLTPLASPPYFTPPLTPNLDLSYNHHGFNPLFESSIDAEFNRIRASPPPKFKFLRDAEEKLCRRKMMEETETETETETENGIHKSDEENESFITLIVDKNKEGRELNHHHDIPLYHSSSSQVLPLASSPSTFTTPANKKAILH